MLEGTLLIDFEDRDTVELTPHPGYTVPRGVVHRTRAPEGRTAILMVRAGGRRSRPARLSATFPRSSPR